MTSRVLLAMQDELSEREDELNRADHAYCAAVSAGFRHMGRRPARDHHILCCGVSVFRVSHNCREII